MSLFPFLLAASILAVTTGCGVKCSTYRADEFLIANFQAHKAEFNTLLEMFRADKGLIYFRGAIQSRKVLSPLASI